MQHIGLISLQVNGFSALDLLSPILLHKKQRKSQQLAFHCVFQREATFEERRGSTEGFVSWGICWMVSWSSQHDSLVLLFWKGQPVLRL